MLREGESSALFRLATYSVLICALIWFGHLRLVVTYTAEAAAREEQVIQSGGRAAQDFWQSRIGQVRMRSDIAKEEGMRYRALSRAVDGAVSKLPLAREMGPVVRFLHNLALACDLTVLSVRADLEVADKANADLVRMRFSLSTKGSYAGVRAFVTRLRTERSAIEWNVVQVVSLGLARLDVGCGVSADIQVEILGRAR